MKKTKNKTIKSIKVLVNGPLYCAVFVSMGISKGCGVRVKEEIIIDKSKSTEQDSIDIEQEDTLDKANEYTEQEDTLGNNAYGGINGEDNPAYVSSSTSSEGDVSDQLNTGGVASNSDQPPNMAQVNLKNNPTVTNQKPILSDNSVSVRSNVEKPSVMQQQQTNRTQGTLKDGNSQSNNSLKKSSKGVHSPTKIRPNAPSKDMNNDDNTVDHDQNGKGAVGLLSSNEQSSNSDLSSKQLKNTTNQVSPSGQNLSLDPLLKLKQKICDLEKLICGLGNLIIEIKKLENLLKKKDLDLMKRVEPFYESNKKLTIDIVKDRVRDKSPKGIEENISMTSQLADSYIQELKRIKNKRKKV